MSKYEEFLKRKLSTKQQLLEAVQALPEDVILVGTGGDLGGYDVSSQHHVSIDVTTGEDGKTYAYFGHLEYEAYQAQEDKEITYKQYQEIVDETEE